MFGQDYHDTKTYGTQHQPHFIALLILTSYHFIFLCYSTSILCGVRLLMLTPSSQTWIEYELSKTHILTYVIRIHQLSKFISSLQFFYLFYFLLTSIFHAASCVVHANEFRLLWVIRWYWLNPMSLSLNRFRDPFWWWRSYLNLWYWIFKVTFFENID